MIITKLTGGIGNQMFQYAMARAVAEQNKVDLGIDISWFDRYKNNLTPREYALDDFNISGKLLKTGIFYRILSKLSFLENIRPPQRKYYIKEKQIFHFDPEVFKISGNVYLDGYWQNEKYFKDIEEIIRKEFTLKNPFNKIISGIAEKISETNSVSLHIRRGDYVKDKITNQLHGVCSLDYYLNAINRILEKVSKPSFFIFSDDIEWAKNNLKLNYSTFFISDNLIKDSEELVLMSKCKHNIIANSSFSWWGAWLNQNPQKIVIAPKQWFKDSSIKTDDLIPDSWQRI
ncbi:hypothetical protein A2999_01225 [Candidatus Wolfebacteria bacterium RIFCSPLOWO2_01_FULL_38_11]|uniref:Glycosyl transferase family 11 n=2 Tax=Candidatus Wolfeibacteriota TaxID=1752735 RepID=A0A1F8DR92_9BACT|nr:MAG: hypothetical protein A2999_01225 [Candidatus Wolfebacteria bacterium RIFCSPLOWO2_01_FULL_38_11]